MNTRIRNKVRLNLAVLQRVSAGVFLSLLIPLILMGVIYRRMNDQILSQYYERSESVLRSSLGNLDLVFDTLDQVAVYLGGTSEIVDFYKLDSIEARNSTTPFLKARQVLNSVGIANNDVLNIQLYSAGSRTLIDFSTIVLFSERYYGSSFIIENYDRERFLREYLQEEVHLGCSREVVSGTRFHGPETALIYQLRHIGSSIRSRNNRILFYLSEKKLLDLFLSLDTYENSSLFLLDENGSILLSHGSGDLSQENVADLLQLSVHPDPIGHYYTDVHHVRMSVSYCRSAERGWVCVSAVPYRQVLSATGSFLNSLIVLFVIALLAGIVLLIVHGIMLAYPAYEIAGIFHPGMEKTEIPQIAERVRELAKKNEQLVETVNQQVSAVKAEAFIRLLTGEDLSETEKRNVLDGIGISRDADFYMILLFNANDVRIDTDLEELAMQRALLDNLLKEQNTLEISDIFPVDIERSVLCLTADAISQREFQRRAEEMVSLARKAVGTGDSISYSVGGDIVNSSGKLFNAFLHAQLALKVPQIIAGSHVIQWYERAKQFAGFNEVDSQAHEDSVSPQNQVLISKIKQYIQENYSNPQLSLSLVGDEFYITEVYLSKLFKKATGENFSHYVEGIRMNRAKELLEQGCKASDVVRQVGYNSPQVYRRAWKRYFGEEEGTKEP